MLPHASVVCLLDLRLRVSPLAGFILGKEAQQQWREHPVVSANIGGCLWLEDDDIQAAYFII